MDPWSLRRNYCGKMPLFSFAVLYRNTSLALASSFARIVAVVGSAPFRSYVANVCRGNSVRQEIKMRGKVKKQKRRKKFAKKNVFLVC